MQTASCTRQVRHLLAGKVGQRWLRKVLELHCMEGSQFARAATNSEVAIGQRGGEPCVPEVEGLPARKPGRDQVEEKGITGRGQEQQTRVGRSRRGLLATTKGSEGGELQVMKQSSKFYLWRCEKRETQAEVQPIRVRLHAKRKVPPTLQDLDAGIVVSVARIFRSGLYYGGFCSR
ncbi:hypothetical protein GOP47_0023557 [Adiantum capillus-veneris]|uniref:Uncharacterized protein n=1 Tax=Adiantum capillus-veneris TaxID=13818 RepID=A0A9D4U448_ADICA|nr:hypothetical protein GOP47_0023557 [Adiantum capillus-veneris]